MMNAAANVGFLIAALPKMSDGTANTLLALAALGQLAVLAAAAIFAWRQVSEARTAREVQVRPYVAIDLHVERTIIYLVVTNHGRSMASDVRFEFDPALDTTMDAVKLETLKMFTDSIPSMPPGKSFSTVFDHFPQREGSGLPDTYRVTIHYRSEPLNCDYTDVVELDLGIYRNLVHSTRKDVHDVHDRLKEIKDEIRKWTAPLGSGLLRLSPDEQRKREEEIEEHFRQLQAQREEEADTEGEEDGGE